GLAVADVLASDDGASLGHETVDLLAQPRQLLLGRSWCGAQVNGVDLALVAGDLLEQWQRQDDRTVFDHRTPINDPDHEEFLGFKLKSIADLFHQHFSGSFAQDDGSLGGVVRQAPGDDLEVFPGKAAPLPRGHDHHLRFLDADQVHEQGASFRDMWKRRDALDSGVTEWFGRQPLAHVADHDVGAAG